MKVGILDYGMGNILSVYNAFSYVGSDVKICRSPLDLDHVDKIVIPGVGAFGDCMKNLEKQKLIDSLERNVINLRKPTLGICLGMQIMALKGYEGGEFHGLGWFDAEVVLLKPTRMNRVPNIGWVEVKYQKSNALFNRLQDGSDFYVVHSYYMKCKEQSDVVATYESEQIITAAIRKGNIFATQFHPEKSQDNGLIIIENFLNWIP